MWVRFTKADFCWLYLHYLPDNEDDHEDNAMEKPLHSLGEALMMADDFFEGEDEKWFWLSLVDLM